MSGREVRVEICSNTVRVFNEADEVAEFYVYLKDSGEVERVAREVLFAILDKLMEIVKEVM
ncbi:MAG: hypothetical protein DRO39_09410 [Thermoprotei archaeon]|nr:MAG: hypothetical protein DRO39_09410 [Thermoprotei archaeon]